MVLLCMVSGMVRTSSGWGGHLCLRNERKKIYERQRKSIVGHLAGVVSIGSANTGVAGAELVGGFMSKEAMKLALEALGNSWTEPGNKQYEFEKEAITALREALANEALDKKAENARELGLDYEPAQQEPVAWRHAGAMPPEQEEMKEAAYQLAPWLSAALDDPKVCKEYKDVINAWFDAAMPAPQRTWVGLSHEEIDYQAKKDDHAFYFAIGALWAEAKLKEKNGG